MVQVWGFGAPTVESEQETIQGEARSWNHSDKGLADGVDHAGSWCWTAA
jgi:hypothetical protein